MREESNSLYSPEGAYSRHPDPDGRVLRAGDREETQNEANGGEDGDKDETGEKGGVEHDVECECQGRA